METIKINNILIDINNHQTYFEIDDCVDGIPGLSVENISIDPDKLKRILFLGFTTDKLPLDNISRANIIEQSALIRGNNALESLNMLVLNSFNYDLFFLSTHGIDPIGVDFLKKLPDAFRELNKKVFIISGKKQQFKFNTT